MLLSIYMRLFRSFTFVISCFIATNSYASYKPTEHLLSGTKDIANSESLTILGIGSALTLSALYFDHSIRDHFHDQHTDDSIYKLGNKFFGEGYFGSIIGLSSVGYGLIADNPHHLNAGEAHLEGLFATGVYTFALKYAIQRPRPAGGSRQSFPSGHTSTMFATTASIVDFYGWTWGTPVLAIAMYTGFGRIYSDAHYLSDVLFGATLGAVVGHAYSIHHKQALADEQKAQFQIVPFYDSKNEFGALFSLKY